MPACVVQAHRSCSPFTVAVHCLRETVRFLVLAQQCAPHPSQAAGLHMHSHPCVNTILCLCHVLCAAAILVKGEWMDPIDYMKDRSKRTCIATARTDKERFIVSLMCNSTKGTGASFKTRESGHVSCWYLLCMLSSCFNVHQRCFHDYSLLDWHVRCCWHMLGFEAMMLRMRGVRM